MEYKPTSTATYLPEVLHDRELYKNMVLILDELLAKMYTPHIKEMSSRYDPASPEYDPESFLTFIDGQKYTGLIPKDSLHQISTILPKLYQLKGTKAGIKFLVGFLGLDVNTITWWEIQRSLAGDKKLYTEWRKYYPQLKVEDIKNCNIYVTVVMDALSNPILQGEDDSVLLALFNVIDTFLWSCAALEQINIVANIPAEEVVVTDVIQNHKEYIKLVQLPFVKDQYATDEEINLDDESHKNILKWVPPIQKLQTYNGRIQYDGFPSISVDTNQMPHIYNDPRLAKLAEEEYIAYYTDFCFSHKYNYEHSDLEIIDDTWEEEEDHITTKMDIKTPIKLHKEKDLPDIYRQHIRYTGRVNYDGTYTYGEQYLKHFVDSFLFWDIEEVDGYTLDISVSDDNPYTDEYVYFKPVPSNGKLLTYTWSINNTLAVLEENRVYVNKSGTVTISCTDSNGKTANKIITVHDKDYELAFHVYNKNKDKIFTLLESEQIGNPNDDDVIANDQIVITNESFFRLESTTEDNPLILPEFITDSLSLSIDESFDHWFNFVASADTNYLRYLNTELVAKGVIRRTPLFFYLEQISYFESKIPKKLYFPKTQPAIIVPSIKGACPFPVYMSLENKQDDADVILDGSNQFVTVTYTSGEGVYDLQGFLYSPVTQHNQVLSDKYVTSSFNTEIVFLDTITDLTIEVTPQTYLKDDIGLATYTYPKGVTDPKEGTWYTSNPNILTIDENGFIKCVGSVDATITIWYVDKLGNVGYAQVNTLQVKIGINVVPSHLQIAYGSSGVFNVYRGWDSLLLNTECTYEIVENEGLVDINRNTVIAPASGDSGKTAKIKVSYVCNVGDLTIDQIRGGEVSDKEVTFVEYVTVELVNYATSIKLSGSDTITIGQELQYLATLTPADSIDTIIGEVSNGLALSIAEVSNGVYTIKGISKGTSTLRAYTASGLTDSMAITCYGTAESIGKLQGVNTEDVKVNFFCPSLSSDSAYAGMTSIEGYGFYYTMPNDVEDKELVVTASNDNYTCTLTNKTFNNKVGYVLGISNLDRDIKLHESTLIKVTSKSNPYVYATEEMYGVYAIVHPRYFSGEAENYSSRKLSDLKDTTNFILGNYGLLCIYLKGFTAKLKTNTNIEVSLKIGAGRFKLGGTSHDSDEYASSIMFNHLLTNNAKLEEFEFAQFLPSIEGSNSFLINILGNVQGYSTVESYQVEIPFTVTKGYSVKLTLDATEYFISDIGKALVTVTNQPDVWTNGSWSVSDINILNIDSTGTFTCLSAGGVNIMYTDCYGCTYQVSLTVLDSSFASTLKLQSTLLKDYNTSKLATKSEDSITYTLTGKASIHALVGDKKGHFIFGLKDFYYGYLDSEDEEVVENISYATNQASVNVSISRTTDDFNKFFAQGSRDLSIKYSINDSDIVNVNTDITLNPVCDIAWIYSSGEKILRRTYYVRGDARIIPEFDVYMLVDGEFTDKSNILVNANGIAGVATVIEATDSVSSDGYYYAHIPIVEIEGEEDDDDNVITEDVGIQKGKYSLTFDPYFPDKETSTTNATRTLDIEVLDLDEFDISGSIDGGYITGTITGEVTEAKVQLTIMKNNIHSVLPNLNFSLYKISANSYSVILEGNNLSLFTSVINIDNIECCNGDILVMVIHDGLGTIVSSSSLVVKKKVLLNY